MPEFSSSGPRRVEIHWVRQAFLPVSRVGQAFLPVSNGGAGIPACLLISGAGIPACLNGGAGIPACHRIREWRTFLSSRTNSNRSEGKNAPPRGSETDRNVCPTYTCWTSPEYGGEGARAYVRVPRLYDATASHVAPFIKTCIAHPSGPPAGRCLKPSSRNVAINLGTSTRGG